MTPVGIGIAILYGPIFLFLVLGTAAVTHRWRKRRAFENTVRDALTFSAVHDDELAGFIHAYLNVEVTEPEYRTDREAS